jgi:hypothetical protein
MRMMIRMWIPGSILVLLIGLWYLSSARGQEDQRFFPETGHSIRGEFLARFEGTPDALRLYGYPITEAIIDPQYGNLVQYFEKARFELETDPANASPVALTPLGIYLYQQGRPHEGQANLATCRRFQEREGNFQVCQAFLDFFEAHGGEAQFGHPISEQEIQGGRIVQYFEKALFEWHPELPAGQRVQLGDLGRRFFKQQALDQEYLRANQTLPREILKLGVRAFPEQAITGLQGNQALGVMVLDQAKEPVSGAEISLQIRSPSGETIEYPLTAITDQHGMARLEVPFEDRVPGLFTMLVQARVGDLTGETTTSFWAWY